MSLYAYGVDIGLGLGMCELCPCERLRPSGGVNLPLVLATYPPRDGGEMLLLLFSLLGQWFYNEVVLILIEKIKN